MPNSDYTAAQLEGSEFGGTTSSNTVQPKGRDALSAGEQLRLHYLVGDITDPLQLTEMSAIDRRQFYGLKPGENRPPNWLMNTGKPPRAATEVDNWPEEYGDGDGG